MRTNKTKCQHPIILKLEKARNKQKMTFQELGVILDVSKDSIKKCTEQKFNALVKLDKWAKALGYELALVPIPTESEYWSG